MSGWAKTPMDRNQVLLFNPTLDATISDNPIIRFGFTMRFCVAVIGLLGRVNMFW